jgi:hypothetical protein
VDDRFAEIDSVPVRLSLRIHKGKRLRVGSVRELYNFGFADLLQPPFQVLGESGFAGAGNGERKYEKGTHDRTPRLIRWSAQYSSIKPQRMLARRGLPDGQISCDSCECRPAWAAKDRRDRVRGKTIFFSRFNLIWRVQS